MNKRFAGILETWYAQNKRELPWRDTKDPYRIWISEVILQQTRVAQGYDYFLRFMKRFPNVEELAAASEDDVLLQWQGLGYYTRARNLHRAARVVSERGGFPKTYQDILQLPGVGEYTAAAISSFAFGEAKAVLDGNVYRVLSRYLGISTPIDSTAGKRDFRALADEMLDAKAPALYNQAIMDFGAVVCAPHPQCETCPLCDTCQAFRTGQVKSLPVKSRSLSVQKRHLIYIYVQCQGYTLLHRRDSSDIWANMYEPLLLEDLPVGGVLSLDAFCGMDSFLVKEISAKEIASMQLVKQGFRHQLSHRLLVADFYLLNCTTRDIFRADWLAEHGYFWCSEVDRDAYASSRLVQEVYKSVTF